MRFAIGAQVSSKAMWHRGKRTCPEFIGTVIHRFLNHKGQSVYTVRDAHGRDWSRVHDELAEITAVNEVIRHAADFL